MVLFTSQYYYSVATLLYLAFFLHSTVAHSKSKCPQGICSTMHSCFFFLLFHPDYSWFDYKHPNSARSSSSQHEQPSPSLQEEASGLTKNQSKPASSVQCPVSLQHEYKDNLMLSFTCF